jgi:hypothetical protein
MSQMKPVLAVLKRQHHLMPVDLEIALQLGQRETVFVAGAQSACSPFR